MLDKKDLSILELLEQDSKLTTNQLARKLNIPVTTVHNRIKKMEKNEIIKKYTIIPNHELLGRNILAHVLVSVNYNLPDGSQVTQESVAKSIKKLGAEEVSIVTGVTDMLVKIRVENVKALNEFIIDKLRSVKGVDKTQTMIVLNSF